jgi:hypothetical protein
MLHEFLNVQWRIRTDRSCHGLAAFLDVVLNKGLGCQVGKRCVMRLVVAGLLIPVSVYARCRGTLSANQFDLNSIENPFGTGSFFSLKSLGSEHGRHRSSAHNQSADIALSATDDPVFCHRQGPSRTTLGIHQRDLKLVNNPKRRNVIKKEGMLCPEGISYTTRPPAYCSCFYGHRLLLTMRTSTGHIPIGMYQLRLRRSDRD